MFRAVWSQNFEIRVAKFFTISKAALILPFQLEDASRPDTAYDTKEEDDVRGGGGLCSGCRFGDALVCELHALLCCPCGHHGLLCCGSTA